MYNSGNSDNQEIRLFTSNDQITLGYDDRIQLVFTPNDPALIPGVESVGEYIRDTAIVNIIVGDFVSINTLLTFICLSQGWRLILKMTIQLKRVEH